MINPRQTININGGEEALLFLPSMYMVAKQRKLSLEVRDANDPMEVRDLYIRIIYLAYLVSWDKKVYDGREKGEPPLRIEDFDIWAYQNGERFGELGALIVEFITGKTPSEILQAKGAEVKKKR